MKILVIDDDMDILDMFNTLLKDLDHECITATTAIDGIKKMIMEQPDGVFLDIRLPDRNGLEVLKEMKQMDMETPVVLMTAYKDAEKAINGFSTGALDLVLKPLNFEYIRNTLMKMYKK